MVDSRGEATSQLTQFHFPWPCLCQPVAWDSLPEGYNAVITMIRPCNLSANVRATSMLLVLSEIQQSMTVRPTVPMVTGAAILKHRGSPVVLARQSLHLENGA